MHTLKSVLNLKNAYICIFLKELLSYINSCKKCTFYDFTVNSFFPYAIIYLLQTKTCSAVRNTRIVNDHLLPEVIIITTLTVFFKI